MNNIIKQYNNNKIEVVLPQCNFNACLNLGQGDLQHSPIIYIHLAYDHQSQHHFKDFLAQVI